MKLITSYVQKSYAFLLPLICNNFADVKKPMIVETYLEWENRFKIKDFQFIVKVDSSADPSKLLILERKHLFASPYFKQEYLTKVGENCFIYVFDFSSISSDYEFFVQGRYSQISDEIKKIILRFYKNTGRYENIESWLYPNLYTKVYSDLLDVSVNLLGPELCNPPDLQKEILKYEPSI